MKTGPPKKPSALEELAGRPGHRPRNDDEPKPEVVSSLAAPAWLDAIGRATWQAHAPELKRLGLLTIIDVQVFAAGCAWWSVYRRATAKLKGQLTAVTKANGKHARAEVRVAQTAFHEAMQTFTRFGITPSERAGLQAPQPKAAGAPLTHEPIDPHDELARRRAARAAGPSPS